MKGLRSIFALFLMTACGAARSDSSGSAPQEARLDADFEASLGRADSLVARVPLGATHAFDVYEISAGVAMYAEHGTVDDEPTHALELGGVEDSDPLELFAVLAP